MYKYQNVSTEEQSLAIEGDITPRIVKPGEEVTSSVPIENPNFKFIGSANTPSDATVVSTQAPQPNMVTDVQPFPLDNETKKENI